MSDLITPRQRAERALRHVSIFPATAEHQEAVIAMVEVEIESALRAERELLTKLWLLLEDCQELIEHLLETQQSAGPMSETGYQKAMQQMDRIKKKTARLKADLAEKENKRPK